MSQVESTEYVTEPYPGSKNYKRTKFSIWNTKFIVCGKQLTICSL